MRNVLKRFLPFILLSLLVAGFSFYGGFIARQENIVKDIAGGDQDTPNVDLAPLWRAWEIIDEEYVFDDRPTDEEKLWGTISGLVDSIGDPYSVFLPPQEATIFQGDISGNFGGVGMEIAIEDDILTVLSPLEGTPAKEAGILAGDKIIQIDGRTTADLSIGEAVVLIRGEQGTEVTLTILRESIMAEGEKENETLEITVVRDIIAIPTIKTETQEGVFIIRFFNFSALSTSLFRDALREFVLTRGDKLIIDVRGNPGGFLESAVDTASWFTPLGKVIVSEDVGGGGTGNVYRSRGYNIFNKNLKLVILIDRGSASASEIFAGALSEYGVATLVGDKTFGKGSVQELFSVTPDTYIKLTVAKWLTPNGVSISEDGLTPDIEVLITKEDIEEERDPQLKRAIDILLNRV